MREKPKPTTKLRRSAWVGVIGGWTIALVFAVAAVAAILLRNAAARHWPAEQQVELFQRDCLNALASSPALAERMQQFCALFNLARSTAEELMLWLACFLIIVAFLGVAHATFSRQVLKYLHE